MTFSKELRRPRCYQWRSYDRESGRLIEHRLRTGRAPDCPLCRKPLEARPSSRYGRCIVLDARGYDLDCRDCRRFWCVVRHTPRSIRLQRMRRLAAAVLAAAPGGEGRGYSRDGAAATA
jgi:hypothetical protein